MSFFVFLLWGSWFATPLRNQLLLLFNMRRESNWRDWSFSPGEGGRDGGIGAGRSVPAPCSAWFKGRSWCRSRCLEIRPGLGLSLAAAFLGRRGKVLTLSTALSRSFSLVAVLVPILMANYLKTLSCWFPPRREKPDLSSFPFDPALLFF